MANQTQLAFRALADPTRRDIVRLLANRDMTVAQLTGHFSMTRAAVKKHLMVLSDGGLVSAETRGRERVNRLEPAGMAPILDWLGYFDRFWGDKLSSLQDAIENREEGDD